MGQPRDLGQATHLIGHHLRRRHLAVYHLLVNEYPYRRRAVTGNLFWEDPILDESVHLLREHRAEMAVWLALEVLQGDRVALDDRELVNRLVACQERLEERLRVKIAARQQGGQAISGAEPLTAGPGDRS